mmetsp:Transcript_35218/g.83534  ORF Transcript_35218/g.83534 Transcript_35218/m.83534 type:complete len:216 (-) Transcript_35218:91-738(-)
MLCARTFDPSPRQQKGPSPPRPARTGSATPLLMPQPRLKALLRMQLKISCCKRPPPPGAGLASPRASMPSEAPPTARRRASPAPSAPPLPRRSACSSRGSRRSPRRQRASREMRARCRGSRAGASSKCRRRRGRPSPRPSPRSHPQRQPPPPPPRLSRLYPPPPPPPPRSSRPSGLKCPRRSLSLFGGLRSPIPLNGPLAEKFGKNFECNSRVLK